MIEVRNLTKKYGDNTAVDNISFDIETGKIYGLLGPNGAGKSTTMNMITGCLAATSGSVIIDGHDIFDDPVEAKKCIGYLPEIPPLYPEMTPFEYLVFVAEAKGVDYEATYRQVNEVMELTQLTDVKDRLIRNLSKGYRQRVGIAQAMLGNPKIIILDEPTVGLDPVQIIEIRDLIRMLGETRTVILSSHILAEVSEVCENLIIINHGKIIANDTLENLNKQMNPADTLDISVKGDEEQIVGVLETTNGILSFEKTESHTEDVLNYKLTVEKDNKDIREDLFFAMAEKRCAVVAIEYAESSLENIFLSLVDNAAVNTDTSDNDSAYIPDETVEETSENVTADNDGTDNNVQTESVSDNTENKEDEN